MAINIQMKKIPFIPNNSIKFSSLSGNISIGTYNLTIACDFKTKIYKIVRSARPVPNWLNKNLHFTHKTLLLNEK